MKVKKQIFLWLLAPVCLMIAAYLWPQLSGGGEFPLRSMRDMQNHPASVFVIATCTLFIAMLIAMPNWINRERVYFLNGFLCGLMLLIVFAEGAVFATFYGGAIGTLRGMADRKSAAPSDV